MDGTLASVKDSLDDVSQAVGVELKVLYRVHNVDAMQRWDGASIAAEDAQ
jgi:hypothetical protein